jgi:hypothetical protein
LQRQEKGRQRKQSSCEHLGHEGESFPPSMLLSFSLLSAASSLEWVVDLQMPGSPGFVAAHQM